jgi:hypothetical protein
VSTRVVWDLRWSLPLNNVIMTFRDLPLNGYIYSTYTMLYIFYRYIYIFIYIYIYKRYTLSPHEEAELSRLTTMPSTCSTRSGSTTVANQAEEAETEPPPLRGSKRKTASDAPPAKKPAKKQCLLDPCTFLSSYNALATATASIHRK